MNNANLNFQLNLAKGNSRYTEDPDQPELAQSNQHLYCPFIELMDSAEYSKRQCHDQTTMTCRLIWSFTVRIWDKNYFLALYIKGK